MSTSLTATVACAVVCVACAAPRGGDVRAPGPPHDAGERIRVLELYPAVTATIVAPAHLDPDRPVDLILYALPNGNTTAETMGALPAEGLGWRHDIQHIAAQTRALRARGLDQAVVVYLEAAGRSWPEWRRTHTRAGERVVDLVDQLRAALGSRARVAVTLTGHSGGGAFTWGFLEGQQALPAWLERIAFLDSNYSYDARHGERIAAWLRGDPARMLVVLAYDDRNIMLDGRRVVSDSGGTWRASQRMLTDLGAAFPLLRDTLGEFIRERADQIEILLHPNPHNRILHTELIGEMNGYMHALLAGRPGYDEPVLMLPRAYTSFITPAVELPAAEPPQIPARRSDAPTGSAFIAALEGLSREAREAAVRRELLAGNIPSFLRVLRPVTVTAPGADGVVRSVTWEVMPDYLAIGSDDDFVRMPMDPHTAQAFCDAFGFVLPTRKMVNDIHAAAEVRVEPRPLTEEREAPRTFLQHHRIIEDQLAGRERGVFVSGIKKDVVVTGRLRERPDRVAIFGWHYLSGQPIQPLYTGHVDWYVDYSHGIRPVRRRLHVAGEPRTYEQILGDAVLHPLLSDEGVIAVPRYER